jgi:hypothetical protein
MGLDISADARDLVAQLLRQDPHSRLGMVRFRNDILNVGFSQLSFLAFFCLFTA